MTITKEDLYTNIKNSFPDSSINIDDLAGDNDHWSVTVKSKYFNDKSRIEQHRLVQDAVKDQDIHALQIKTLPTNK